MIWTAILSALWLGILTAISPCPLATNIAAISFIGKNVGNKKKILLSGLLYSAGRTTVYLILGIGLSAGFLASSQASLFLQKHINEAIGPILIVLGLILLGWVGSSFSTSFGSGKFKEKVMKKGNPLWSFPIGLLFALSFCPVSAGLFFGGLIPMALKNNSILLMPFFYGLGTALPVIFFAFLIAFSSAYVGKAFSKLSALEKWVRWLTGLLFILSGIYLTLIHIYDLSLF